MTRPEASRCTMSKAWIDPAMFFDRSIDARRERLLRRVDHELARVKPGRPGPLGPGGQVAGKPGQLANVGRGEVLDRDLADDRLAAEGQRTSSCFPRPARTSRFRPDLSAT